jgi:hypothetical protein
VKNCHSIERVEKPFAGKGFGATYCFGITRNSRTLHLNHEKGKARKARERRDLGLGSRANRVVRFECRVKSRQMVDSTAIAVVAPLAGTFMLGSVWVLRRRGAPPAMVGSALTVYESETVSVFAVDKGHE